MALGIKKFLSHIDLAGNIVKNARWDVRSSDPSTPASGQVWFNSTDGKLKLYDGTTTRFLLDTGRIVNADIAAGANIALSKLAVDVLNRANHTGTQLASTISDFNTQRDAQRLDQHAAPTNPVSFGGQRGTNAADGTASTDLTTLQQVQTLVTQTATGLDQKASVRVAAVANVNVSSAPATIDGVTLGSGDRVLLAGQTTGSQNGIYVFSASGAALTRSSDADTSAEVTSGMYTMVSEGSATVSGLYFLTTPDPITLGTTALTFTRLPIEVVTASGVLSKVGADIQLTGTVPLAKGGTGGTTAQTARASLQSPGRDTRALTWNGTAKTAVIELGLAWNPGLSVKVFVATFGSGTTTYEEVEADVSQVVESTANFITIAVPTPPPNGESWLVSWVGGHIAGGSTAQVGVTYS